MIGVGVTSECRTQIYSDARFDPKTIIENMHWMCRKRLSMPVISDSTIT